MKHSNKLSRYRICFQTKNKVWIYKNSRLRNFYKIRSKIILKTGKRARKFLITKNMKWTVMRRQMVPYFRKVRRYSCLFKKLFFTKQQLKNFYGGLKEYQLRNFFKQTWNKEHVFKTNIFIGSLEQRLNVILYRMRLLPTIFACNQLVQHKGVLVNNQKITFLNYRVNLGDVISIEKDYWLIFYRFIYKRLCIRYLGEGYAIYRKYAKIKKLQLYFSRKKHFFFSNLKMRQIFFKHLMSTVLIKNSLKTLYFKIKNILKKKNLLKKKKKILIWFRMFYWFFKRNFFVKILNIKKSFKFFFFWGKKHLYLKKMTYLLFQLKSLQLKMKKFLLLIQNFLFKKFFKMPEQLKKNLKIYENTNSYLLKRFYNLTLLNYKKKYWKKQKTFFPKLQNRYFQWIVRNFKFRRNRKNFFKHLCLEFNWYTPQYLEIDFNTLRACFIYYPSPKEVFFSFNCSFDRIVSFYKERAL